MGLGAILGIGGSLIQAGSASSAAKKQEAAANRDLEFQRETRDLIFDRLDPWYQGGNLANEAMMFELGLGARPVVGGTAPQIETVVTPGTAGSGVTSYKVGDKTFTTLDEAQAWANANKTGGTNYAGFTATPGYQFRVDSGNDSINALAGARGGLVSGRTMQDLAKFNQGIASEEYGNYLARLGGMSGDGLGAASGQATAATNAAQGVSNALAGIGNAQAAGAIGVGNAINGGIQNGIGLWQYQRAMAPQQTGGLTTSPRPQPNPWY